ncbi:MAG: ACP S-malonyltransferase [Chloroflexota bacterium]|nr:ACP S-malonyltransferase [Chloroflexota bacterium]
MSLQEQLGPTVAFVFPGQGSQFAGMGRELYERSPAARATIDEADQVLGTSLSTLAFEGPVEALNDTFNAQPAILTVSVAALRAFNERAEADGGPVTPIVVAGHSLGQFTALVAAGSLGFAETLTLVRERGRLMAEAGTARPGGMAAVLGLDEVDLVEVCAQASSEGIINVANANCPGQIVISGEVGALERAMELAKSAGAKRVARLPVSIASHSPLMEDVSRQLKALTDALPFKDSAFPIVGNVSGKPIISVAEIRTELEHHVERPVNWTGSVQEMVALGADTFVELGPGTVLAGLIKRIDRGVKTASLADLGL